MKTKQETIQNQIDEIMDTFDFARVREMMTAVNWEWHGIGTPEEHDLRSAARERLKEAVKVGYSSSGGFTAIKREGKDDEGPWVQMNLSFGIDSALDGESYKP